MKSTTHTVTILRKFYCLFSLDVMRKHQLRFGGSCIVYHVHSVHSVHIDIHTRTRLPYPTHTMGWLIASVVLRINVSFRIFRGSLCSCKSFHLNDRTNGFYVAKETICFRCVFFSLPSLINQISFVQFRNNIHFFNIWSDVDVEIRFRCFFFFLFLPFYDAWL